MPTHSDPAGTITRKTRQTEYLTKCLSWISYNLSCTSVRTWRELFASVGQKGPYYIPFVHFYDVRSIASALAVANANGGNIFFHPTMFCANSHVIGGRHASHFSLNVASVEESTRNLANVTAMRDMLLFIVLCLPNMHLLNMKPAGLRMLSTLVRLLLLANEAIDVASYYCLLALSVVIRLLSLSLLFRCACTDVFNECGLLPTGSCRVQRAIHDTRSVASCCG